MARNARAAALILGGVPWAPGEGARAARETLTRYAAAGLRAYLFPGALLAEPEVLGELVIAAREIARASGLGRPLLAIGGSTGPAFGSPPYAPALHPLGIAALGGAMRFAKSAARHTGRMLADAAGACGLDLVLGPSLDLATDPKIQSGVLDLFGEDALLAAALGSAYIKGMAAGGIAACAGRFPGIGSSSPEGPSSTRLVVLSKERLESVEMLPFAKAIRGGCPAMLVGRALVPALEPERVPAARSERVVEGKLREELRFKGLVIGDELEGEAEVGRAAILGALAGCDLSLAGRPETALRAAAALDKAAASGELPLPRVEVSSMRLERFLAGRPRALPELGIAASLPRQSTRERAARDRELSITILRGEGDFTLSREGSLVLAFMPPAAAADAPEAGRALAALREGLPGREILSLPADPSPRDSAALIETLESSRSRGLSEAAILTYDAHFRPAQEALARLLEESVPRCLVVAMRDPYDAAFFPHAAGLAAAYGFSESGARAVAKLLSGSLDATGRCPVQVIGLEP
jgi:beta-N-acetylhexosaminidase